MGKIQVKFNAADGLVTLGGYALPRLFSATFSQDDLGEVRLHLRVDDANRVQVHHFEFVATENHPEVTASDLRNFPLSTWRDAAIQMAAQPVQVSEDGSQTIVMGGMTNDRLAVHEANKRRARVNADTLKRVAAIVAEHPLGPTERPGKAASIAAYEAIAAEFESSRRTAQLWVKRAKDAGLL